MVLNNVGKPEEQQALQHFGIPVCALEDVKPLHSVTVFQANHRMRLIISFTNGR